MTRIDLRTRHVIFTVVAVLLSFVALPGTLQAQNDPPPGKATVVVSALNVRKGPATTYEKLGLVKAGDELKVRGRLNTCTWLYVETPTGAAGWVASSARFVKLDSACSEIPEVDPATAEIVTQPGAAAGGTTGASSSSDKSAAPTSTPTPAANSLPVDQVTPAGPTAVATPPVIFYGTAVPEGQGCIAWGNYAGPDILVTATHREPREIVETTLPNNQVTVVCYNPGLWSFTVSAISNRFRDLNFEATINAGDTLDWPFVSNR